MPSLHCPFCGGSLSPAYPGTNDPWPRPLPGMWHCAECERVTLEGVFEEDIEADYLLERRRDRD